MAASSEEWATPRMNDWSIFEDVDRELLQVDDGGVAGRRSRRWRDGRPSRRMACSWRRMSGSLRSTPRSLSSSSRAARVDAASPQALGTTCGEVAPDELAERDVDGDARRWAGPRPSRTRTCWQAVRRTQLPMRHHEAELFGQGHELRGGDRAQLRRLPAQERFRGGDPRRGPFDQGLVVELELAAGAGRWPAGG